MPVVVFTLVSAFPSRHAAAQEGPLSPLGLRLGTSVTWDSNVFRVPDGAQSDTFRTTFAGLDLDKSFSQQRLTASITKRETRYDKFTSLDRDALDYNGNFYWRAGPRFSGVLHVDHSESEVSFDDAQGTTTLIKRTTDRHDASVDVLIYNRWHLLARFYDAKSTTSQVFLAQPSTDINAREVGLRYVTGSLNSVTFTRRSRTGQNILPGGLIANLIDTDFTENEGELQATWNVTGKSTLNGRLTWLERTHQHLPQRDFSGTAGELGYFWTPTGKLSFRLSAIRTILPWTADTQASYRVDDLLVLRPTWQVSDKVKLSLTPLLRVSDFRGPVAALTGPLRRDTLRSVTFTADWSPVDGVLLSAALQHQQRRSTIPNLDFKDRIATLNALLKF